MIASPCVNVCQMSPEIGLCSGCLRTLDEISRWSVMHDEERAQVIAATAERRSRFAAILPAPGSAASVTTTLAGQGHNSLNRR